MVWIWFALFVFCAIVLVLTYRELERKRNEIAHLDTCIDFWRLNTQALNARVRELETANRRQADSHHAEMELLAATASQLWAPLEMERHD
jgi:hypothetical protein